MKKWGRLAILPLAALLFLVEPASSFAESPESTGGFTGLTPPEPHSESEMTAGHGDDIRVMQVPAPEGQVLAPLASDSLGLLVGVDAQREHSLGTDKLGVWVCPELGMSASQVASNFNSAVRPYFQWLSEGAYQPSFVAVGTADSCDPQISVSTYPAGLEGGLMVGPWSGGYAGPGAICGAQACGYPGFPQNSRYGVIGYGLWRTTVAHEMGHMIHWPHSYTGASSWEYDDATEVMSGNYGLVGSGGFGSYPDPYATMSINRYAAGWMPTSRVRVYDGSAAKLSLLAVGGNGVQMVVIPSGSSFYVLTSRVGHSMYDPIPSVWKGVTVHKVDTCGDAYCGELGWRRVMPDPAVPFDYSARTGYDQPLPHQLRPGESRTVGGATVKVTGTVANGFSVEIGGSAGAPSGWLGTFVDDDGNVHESNIEAIAAAGVTAGCSSVGPRYCPADVVTRGQMASFLARAFGFPAASRDWFPDDGGSVHEDNINRIAEAGVTRGLGDGSYGPNGWVTREQMGSFLARAMGLAPVAGDRFSDVSGVHEQNINAIAGAGVTLGCDAGGTLFCPRDLVRRDQMASFLARAMAATAP